MGELFSRHRESVKVVLLGFVSCALWAGASELIAKAFEGASATKAWGRADIFLLLMGCYALLLASVLLLRFVRLPPKSSQGNPETLAFRLMTEQCEFLLKAYRGLWGADPEHSKRPLSHVDSWPLPESNSTWTYTQLSLYRLAKDYRWLAGTAKAAFAEMGWKEYVPLFNETPDYMVDVVAILEKFERTLEKKIELLEGRARA
jgi:hypothetical protein